MDGILDVTRPPGRGEGRGYTSIRGGYALSVCVGARKEACGHLELVVLSSGRMPGAYLTLNHRSSLDYYETHTIYSTPPMTLTNRLSLAPPKFQGRGGVLSDAEYPCEVASHRSPF